MYPKLQINIKKLKHNASTLNAICKKNDINMVFVSKVINSDNFLLSHFQNFDFFADSSINNLKKIKHLKPKKLLLRIPSLHETKEVIKYADMSLNSELKTIQKLNKEAKKQNKIHKILLMIDLGDLREGYFNINHLLNDAKDILTCKNIKIAGIGTNLTCFGGILPSEKNMKKLLHVKQKLEKLGIKIDIISGGNSSSLNMLLNNKMPKGINQLRIGESVFTGKFTLDYKPIKNLFTDIFILKAKIVELKLKPSKPIGKIGFNAFGEKITFEDSGNIKRAILNIGKASIDPNHIIPKQKNVKILGASSDHLILDISTCKKKFRLGNTVSFNISYAGILTAFNSLHINKKYI